MYIVETTGYNEVYSILIAIYHIRTPTKASVPIWDTDKKPVWSDKAGGYGIQDPFGMKYIKRIEGDYYNVVGLPISRLYHELKKLSDL